MVRVTLMLVHGLSAALYTHKHRGLHDSVLYCRECSVVCFLINVH